MKIGGLWRNWSLGKIGGFSDYRQKSGGFDVRNSGNTSGQGVCLQNAEHPRSALESLEAAHVAHEAINFDNKVEASKKFKIFKWNIC